MLTYRNKSNIYQTFCIILYFGLPSCISADANKNHVTPTAVRIPLTPISHTGCSLAMMEQTNVQVRRETLCNTDDIFIIMCGH